MSNRILLLSSVLLAATVAAQAGTPAPSADIHLVKSAPATAIWPGTVFSYSFTVSNSGPDSATNVTLSDDFADSLQFVGATPSQGSGFVNLSTNQLTFNFGTIPSGSSASLIMTWNPTTTGTLVNGASVTLSEYDPNLADNATTITTGIHCTDIAVSPGSVNVACSMTKDECTIDALVQVSMGVADLPPPKSSLLVMISNDEVPSGDDLFLKPLKLKPLKPGQVTTLKMRTKVKSGLVGPGSRLLVVADPDGVIHEFDESNNQATLPLVP